MADQPPPQPSEPQLNELNPCCSERQSAYLEALHRLQLYDMHCRDQAVQLSQLVNALGEYRMAYEFQCLQNSYLLQAIEEKHQALIFEKQQVAYLHTSLLSLQNKYQNPGATSTTNATSGEIIISPQNMNAVTSQGIMIPRINDFVRPIILQPMNYDDNVDDVEIDVVNVSPSPSIIPKGPLENEPMNMMRAPMQPMQPMQGLSEHRNEGIQASVTFNYPPPAYSSQHHYIPQRIPGRNVQTQSIQKSAVTISQPLNLNCSKKQRASSSVDLLSIRWKPFDFAGIDPTVKGQATVSGYAVVKVDMVRGKNSSNQQQKKKNYCNFVAKIKEEAMLEGQKVYSVCYMRRKCSFLKDENKSTCFVADNSGGDYLCLEEDVVMYLPDPYEDRRGKIHFDKSVNFTAFSLYQ